MKWNLNIGPRKGAGIYVAIEERDSDMYERGPPHGSRRRGAEPENVSRKWYPVKKRVGDSSGAERGRVHVRSSLHA